LGGTNFQDDFPMEEPPSTPRERIAGQEANPKPSQRALVYETAKTDKKFLTP